MSCIHVTSHEPMWHVMYQCDMSCIHVTCNVLMSHSNSHVILFCKSEDWITLDNLQYYKCRSKIGKKNMDFAYFPQNIGVLV